MMETDTLMAEAFFFIRIENSHQEKTATPFIEKRETGGAKLFPERNAKAVFPGNDGNRGRQYGRNTAENSNRQEYLRHHAQRSFFDIAFQYEFIKYSAIVAQRILFYGGKNLPGTAKRKKSPSVSGDIHDIFCNFSP
ncbi:MAG: hypothetical protein K1W09_09795 [Akkermansia muciniphila]|uniref:hypothetical protein n=2 Tax=uncultured Akkermansia sp. TaxID=512294 RepID=UPI00261C66A7|nr:hypothetical protein [uncultured Akkermansia sp.]